MVSIKPIEGTPSWQAFDESVSISLPSFSDDQESERLSQAIGKCVYVRVFVLMSRVYGEIVSRQDTTGSTARIRPPAGRTRRLEGIQRSDVHTICLYAKRQLTQRWT